MYSVPGNCAVFSWMWAGVGERFLEWTLYTEGCSDCQSNKLVWAIAGGPDSKHTTAHLLHNPWSLITCNQLQIKKNVSSHPLTQVTAAGEPATGCPQPAAYSYSWLSTFQSTQQTIKLVNLTIHKYKAKQFRILPLPTINLKLSLLLQRVIILLVPHG